MIYNLWYSIEFGILGERRRIKLQLKRDRVQRMRKLLDKKMKEKKEKRGEEDKLKKEGKGKGKGKGASKDDEEEEGGGGGGGEGRDDKDEIEKLQVALDRAAAELATQEKMEVSV